MGHVIRNTRRGTRRIHEGVIDPIEGQPERWEKEALRDAFRAMPSCAVNTSAEPVPHEAHQ